MLKSTALVEYPVHVVVQNSSAVYQRWLLENGQPLSEFLPAKMGTTIDSVLSGEGRGNYAQF